MASRPPSPVILDLDTLGEGGGSGIAALRAKEEISRFATAEEGDRRDKVFGDHILGEIRNANADLGRDGGTLSPHPFHLVPC